jgi:hypothetical protein
VEALAKILRHFIVRDTVYIAGGGMLVTTILYVFGHLDERTLSQVPGAFYFLAVAVCHPIGFAVADAASTLCPRLIPAHALWRPRRLTQCFFERLTRSPWHDVKVDTDKVKNEAEMEALKDFGPYHRLVMLRHVGIVNGLSAALSSLVLGFGLYWRGVAAYDVTLVLLAAIVGFCLLIAGGVKAAQQADYLRRQSLATSKPVSDVVSE